jgi:hypothetical protein
MGFGFDTTRRTAFTLGLASALLTLALIAPALLVLLVA